MAIFCKIFLPVVPPQWAGTTKEIKKGFDVASNPFLIQLQIL